MYHAMINKKMTLLDYILTVTWIVSAAIFIVFVALTLANIITWNIAFSLIPLYIWFCILGYSFIMGMLEAIEDKKKEFNTITMLKTANMMKLENDILCILKKHNIDKLIRVEYVIETKLLLFTSNVGMLVGNDGKNLTELEEIAKKYGLDGVECITTLGTVPDRSWTKAEIDFVEKRDNKYQRL